MKVTLLGHASVLVEMAGAVCLMDPVFFDPFEEGAVVSCPKRAVHSESLPPVDTLIVSHRQPAPAAGPFDALTAQRDGGV